MTANISGVLPVCNDDRKDDVMSGWVRGSAIGEPLSTRVTWLTLESAASATFNTCASLDVTACWSNRASSCIGHHSQ